MTPEGADLLARQVGWRFDGFMPPQLPGRFLAVYVPDPDDGREAVIADGRTEARALRRGLALCEHLARGGTLEGSTVRL